MARWKVRDGGAAGGHDVDANPGKLAILPWMMSGGSFPSGSFLTFFGLSLSYF